MFIIIGGETSMGIRDTFKHASEIQKQAKWKWGIYATIVEVGDSYVHLEGGGKIVNIYYKDFQKVERRGNGIEIRTITDKYLLTPKGLRGAKDLADELYAELTEKINQHNTSESSASAGGEAPSFCGNCGQALSGENFCPKCGTEVRKI